VHPNTQQRKEQLEDILNIPDRPSIAGGDYNTNHADWVSRLITPRG
jgi:hypothetical protein